MSNQDSDMSDSHKPSLPCTKPQLSKAVVIGSISLIIGGVCAFFSFNVGFATYTNAPAQQSARIWNVVLAMVAFLFLWHAWRSLKRNGKLLALALGVANAVQLMMKIL